MRGGRASLYSLISDLSRGRPRSRTSASDEHRRETTGHSLLRAPASVWVHRTSTANYSRIRVNGLDSRIPNMEANGATLHTRGAPLCCHGGHQPWQAHPHAHTALSRARPRGRAGPPTRGGQPTAMAAGARRDLALPAYGVYCVLLYSEE